MPSDWRSVAGISTKAHQRVGDWKVQASRNPRQHIGRITLNHAATRVDHRTARPHQVFNRTPNLARVTSRCRRIRAQRHGLGVLIGGRDRRVSRVFGNIDHHRAGPSGGRDVERLLDDQRNLGDILDQEAVFHNGARHTDHVGFLERIGAYQVARHLAGDDHQRYRIHVGRRNPSDRVGGAGTRGDQHDTRTPSGTRVTVGHMSRRLFVPHQHVLHPLLTEYRIIDMQRRTTRITE